MILVDVANDLRDALKTIDGLRVPPWGVEQVSPPAALVGMPDTIQYDATKQRGFDRFPDWQISVLLARHGERVSQKQIAAYMDGSGPFSVKAAIEAWEYESCDTVRVTSAEPSFLVFQEVPYIGVLFHTDITGRGTSQ